MNSKWAFLLAGMLLFARTAEADPFVLSDLNSSFSVNAENPAGAFSWQVDGTEHLFREWFWYRALFMSRERTIDRTATGVAAAFTATTSDSGDADAAHDILVVTYNHPKSTTDPTFAYTIQVEYDLNGSPTNTGVSSVKEKVTITNHLPGNLSFHLFEYSDFSVNGTKDDDTATLMNPSTIMQTDASGGSATVTVTQPVPDRYQIAPVPTIETSLNNTSTTNLPNSTTNVSGGANMAFAFQWSEIIAPGSTWVIDKQKDIVGLAAAVPEPGSMLLVGTGLLGLREWNRRKKLKRGESRSS